MLRHRLDRPSASCHCLYPVPMFGMMARFLIFHRHAFERFHTT